MKKTLVTGSLLVALAFLMQFCSTTRKTAEQPKVAKITYQGNVKELIETKCTPCHIPGKGNKTPYVTYDAVKADYEDIMKRVHMNPGERGFMPMRKEKLSDSALTLLAAWKTDGFLDK